MSQQSELDEIYDILFDYQLALDTIDVKEKKDVYTPLEADAYRTRCLEDIVDRLQALLNKRIAEAFRNGQLDCQKAGDPTNHRYFKEATDKRIAEARIDELIKLWESGMTRDGGIIHVDYGKITEYYNQRIDDLKAKDSK